jgi:predicted nucleotide-binding protein
VSVKRDVLTAVPQNRWMSVMPAPGSDNARRLLQTVWDLFERAGDWPTVGQVANRMDQQHDLVFEDVLPEVPAQLLYGIHPSRVPSDNEMVGLTVAGAAATEGAADDLRLVVAAVGFAAQMQRRWTPPAEDPNAELSLTASQIGRELQLPAADSAVLLARVGALLRTDNWGWSVASHGDAPDAWSFTIDRRVRRFRGVSGVDDFWVRAHPPSPVEGANAPPLTTRLGISTWHGIGQTVSRSSVGKRTVFLVHGRDHDARDALIELLRAFDVRVVTWREAASRAGGGGTPYTGDIVRAGMEMADAVVVLLTPDDVGYARSIFHQDRDGADELRPTGQARLNVIFEAGMAMALGRERVVIVEVGATRGLSDTAGIHTIRLHDHVESRKDFAARLRDAGLTVDTDGEQWRTAGTFDRPPLTARDLTVNPEAPSDRGAPGAGQAEQQQETLRLTDTLVASNLRRLDTPFSTDVVGELTNESDTAFNLVLLGATFLDQAGRIVGTADGSVNGLPVGATKSFRLTSLGVIQDAASFKVQSNGQM